MKVSKPAKTSSYISQYGFYGAMILIFFLTIAVRLYYITTLREIVIYPDSIEYLRAADKLSMLKIDVSRLPVYPFFILLAHLIFPWLTRMQAVILLQILISGVSMSLIFYVSYRLFDSSIKAFIASVFILSTLWLVSWDFLILTESLMVFLIVVSFLFFMLYLQTFKKRFMMLTYALSGILIFLKPVYLLLPVVLFGIFIFRGIVEGKQKQSFMTGVASLAVIYLLVASYCLLNFKMNNYLGVSEVSAINKMGKVLQYRMYELGNNEKIKVYIREESELKEGQTLEPVDFIYKYGLEKNGFEEVNAFTGAIIKNHLLQYAESTLKLLFNGDKLYKQNAFADYNVKNYIENRPDGFFYYIHRIPFKLTFGMIYYLMLGELIFIIFLIIRRKKYEWHWIFTSLFIYYQVIMSVAGAHAEYPRLVVPAYIMLFLTLFKYLFLMFDLLKKSSARTRKYIKSIL